MTEATDKLTADMTADLAAVSAEVVALQAQLASKDAQIAALSEPAPNPFVHVTVTNDPAHAKFEFYDGSVVEKDIPDTLTFTVDMG